MERGEREMKHEKKNRKLEGKHDYSGSWSPGQAPGMCQTFSVGVFQWLPKANGKGLKKSAVKLRVRGSSSYPGKVYHYAETACDDFDMGIPYEMKTITV